MHPILAYRNIDTRTITKLLKSVTFPPLEYVGELLEGNQKAVNELDVVQKITAKVIPGCSQRASNSAARAELGIHSLKTRRDLRKPK